MINTYLKTYFHSLTAEDALEYQLHYQLTQTQDFPIRSQHRNVVLLCHREDKAPHYSDDSQTQPSRKIPGKAPGCQHKCQA